MFVRCLSTSLFVLLLLSLVAFAQTRGGGGTNSSGANTDHLVPNVIPPSPSFRGIVVGSSRWLLRGLGGLCGALVLLAGQKLGENPRRSHVNLGDRQPLGDDRPLCSWSAVQFVCTVSLCDSRKRSDWRLSAVLA
jgi:hypothetical protein